MRIVADTNVLISALFWRKQLAEIADLINERKVVLCFSPETIDELYRVANYPHIARKAQEFSVNPNVLLGDVITFSLIVHPSLSISVVTDDPSDNMFLACALAAQASFIISGDQHLLNLKRFHNIPILTPHQFLIHLKKKRS